MHQTSSKQTILGSIGQDGACRETLTVSDHFVAGRISQDRRVTLRLPLGLFKTTDTVRVFLTVPRLRATKVQRRSLVDFTPLSHRPIVRTCRLDIAFGVDISLRGVNGLTLHRKVIAGRGPNHHFVWQSTRWAAARIPVFLTLALAAAGIAWGFYLCAGFYIVVWRLLTGPCGPVC